MKRYKVRYTEIIGSLASGMYVKRHERRAIVVVGDREEIEFTYGLYEDVHIVELVEGEPAYV